MFEAFELQFPILVPRNFVMMFDKGQITKINKLTFTEQDFFKTENELINEFQIKSNAIFSLNEEKEMLNTLKFNVYSLSQQLSTLFPCSIGIWYLGNNVIIFSNKETQYKHHTRASTV